MNDEKRIPVAVAAELISARIQNQQAVERDLVLLEAIALLTARLHRAGLADADRLAADLLAVFEPDQPPGLDRERLLDMAQLVAGRIRGAAQGVQEPEQPDSGSTG